MSYGTLVQQPVAYQLSDNSNLDIDKMKAMVKEKTKEEIGMDAEPIQFKSM